MESKRTKETQVIDVRLYCIFLIGETVDCIVFSEEVRVKRRSCNP